MCQGLLQLLLTAYRLLNAILIIQVLYVVSLAVSSPGTGYKLLSTVFPSGQKDHDRILPIQR